MLNFEDCLSMMRKKHPNQLIRNAFLYGDLYVFTIANGLEYIKHDMNLMNESVDRNTGKIEFFDYWDFFYSKSEELNKISVIQIDTKSRT